jgi:hypothetical protein
LQLGNFNNFCPLLAFDSYLLIDLFDDSVKKNTSTHVGWLICAVAPGAGHQGGRGATAAAMVGVCFISPAYT